MQYFGQASQCCALGKLSSERGLDEPDSAYEVIPDRRFFVPGRQGLGLFYLRPANHIVGRLSDGKAGAGRGQDSTLYQTAVGSYILAGKTIGIAGCRAGSSLRSSHSDHLSVNLRLLIASRSSSKI